MNAEAELTPIDSAVEHRPITTLPWPQEKDDDEEELGLNELSRRETLTAYV